MGTMGSQITSPTIVYSTVYSGADQRKHPSLTFARGIHRWPVNSPHKGPVTRKMFPFDDAITRNADRFFSALMCNTVSGCIQLLPWWRHQMETFSALLAIYAGNSSVTGEFPAQRPVTRSFDVFFDLWLNKRLSKQWWGWWFETPPRPLWRHSNEWPTHSINKGHAQQLKTNNKTRDKNKGTYTLNFETEFAM